jgi:hypothetical protein
MPGTMESLTFAQQLEELGRMAVSLVKVITSNKGSMSIDDALTAASEDARVPASFMKYGLSFAESERLVVVDDFESKVSTPRSVLIATA